jgi:hypothetical protein
MIEGVSEANHIHTGGADGRVEAPASIGITGGVVRPGQELGPSEVSGRNTIMENPGPASSARQPDAKWTGIPIPRGPKEDAPLGLALAVRVGLRSPDDHQPPNELGELRANPQLPGGSRQSIMETRPFRDHGSDQCPYSRPIAFLRACSKADRPKVVAIFRPPSGSVRRPSRRGPRVNPSGRARLRCLRTCCRVCGREAGSDSKLRGSREITT